MQRERNYGIDILRGIALILISIYHYYQFQGTYIGVIIFFALSGYLVTESLLTEEFQYVEYWKKKVLKLYPLFLFVIIVSTLFVFLLEKGLSSHYRYGALASLFALNNLYQSVSKISYFESHSEILPLVHTWALSLEIQFYFLFPFLLQKLKSYHKTKKEIAEIFLFLASLSMLCMFFRYLKGEDLSRIYYGTDTRLFTFFLAAAVSSYTKGESLKNKNLILFLGGLGFLSVVVFSFFFNYTSAVNYLGGLYLASLFLSYTILACLRFDFLQKVTFYPARLLAHLGEHGYSYYLWQYVIMIFANEYFKWVKISYHITVLLQVFLLVGVSEATYYWIEKRKFSWKELGLAFFLAFALLIFLPGADLEENELLEESVVTKATVKKSYPSNQIEESLSYGKEEASKEVIEVQKEKEKEEEIVTEEAVVPGKYSGQITFVGDSVMKMCENDLKKEFPNAYVDAAVSRQFVKLPMILEQLKQQGKLYHIVVIHLGSNGPIPEKSFQKVMELLKGHKVYFMNAVVSKTWETEVNRLLSEKAMEYEEVELLDWYQFAKGKTKWFYKDATHPKPNGAKKYSHFVLEEIRKREE